MAESFFTKISTPRKGKCAHQNKSGDLLLCSHNSGLETLVDLDSAASFACDSAAAARAFLLDSSSWIALRGW
jgi:hypothetical protein